MRRLDSLLKKSSDLRTLSAQAEHINALQKTWETVVPPSLKRHCRAGLINNQRLTVYASSGAIAAKLKLLASGLLLKLQSQGLEVTAIRVEVQVESEPKRDVRKIRSLSEAAVASLESFAESLPDSPLRTSIKRLSRRR
jgi:hypothetical protein